MPQEIENKTKMSNTKEDSKTESHALSSSVSGISEGNYWKERCRLTENYLDVHSEVGDITEDQVNANTELTEFLVMKGNKDYR